MAHESFEDPEIAALMNEHYVPVKVDREERPDVDAVYMDAVTAMTGHGGWPMTVFLTPTGEPFYAGTYFPPRARGELPGFPDVLVAVSQTWRERSDDVRHQASAVLAPDRADARAPPWVTPRGPDGRRLCCRAGCAHQAVRLRAGWLRCRPQVPPEHGAGVPRAPPRAHRDRRMRC